MYFQKIGFGFDGTGCGGIPTCRLRVISPIHSAVGRMTPSTLRVASITGRLICWMVRKAFADAVLHANITKGHPGSNSLLTACRVNS